MDRRTQARELAMQGLYQLDVQGGDFLDSLEGFLREHSPADMVYDMADTWTRGAWENVDSCDELIKTVAVKWELPRLCQVDKSILRLAVYQLNLCPEIPGKGIINEAIEMAKKYSSEQSPRFVNGVLDAVLKRVRSE